MTPTPDDVDAAIAALDRRWRAFLVTLLLATFDVLLLYTIISLLWG